MSTAEPSAQVLAKPDVSPATSGAAGQPLSSLDDASPEIANNGQDAVTPAGDASAGFATFSNAARGNTVHLQNGKNFKIPGTQDPLLAKKGKKATSGFGAYAKSRSTEALDELGEVERAASHDSTLGDAPVSPSAMRLRTQSAADSLDKGSPGARRRPLSSGEPPGSPKVARLIMKKGGPRLGSEGSLLSDDDVANGENGDDDDHPLSPLSPAGPDKPATPKPSKTRFKLFGGSRTKAKDSSHSNKRRLSSASLGDEKKKKRNPVKALKKWFAKKSGRSSSRRSSSEDGAGSDDGAGPATPDPDEDLTIEVPDAAEHPQGSPGDTSASPGSRPRGFESVHRKNPLYGDGASQADTSSAAENTVDGGDDASVNNDGVMTVTSAEQVPLTSVTENEDGESNAKETMAASPDAEGQGNDAAKAPPAALGGEADAVKTPPSQPPEESPSRKESYSNLDLDAVTAAPRLDNSSALARGRLSTRGMSKRKPTMTRRTKAGAKRPTDPSSPGNDGDMSPEPLPEPEAGLSPVKPLEMSPIKKAGAPGLADVTDAPEASPAVLADVTAAPEVSPAVAAPIMDAAAVSPRADAAPAPVNKSKLELARERVAREKAESAKNRAAPAVQMRPRAATSAPGGARPVSMLQKQQKDNRRMSFGIAAELNSILGGRGGGGRGGGRDGRGRNMAFPGMGGASPNKALAKFANEAKQVSPIRTGDGVAAAKDLFESTAEPKSAAGKLPPPGGRDAIAEDEEPAEQIQPKPARPSMTPMFLGEIHTKLGIKDRPAPLPEPDANATPAPVLEIDEDGLPATPAPAEETEAASDESNAFFKEAPADGPDTAAPAIVTTEDATPDAAPEPALQAVPEDATPDAAPEAALQAVPEVATPDAAPEAALQAVSEVATPDAAPEAALQAVPDAVLEAVPEATPETASEGAPKAAASVLGAELAATAAADPSPLSRSPTLIPSKGTDPESLRAFNLSRAPTTRTAAGIAFIEEQRRLREQQNALFGGGDDEDDSEDKDDEKFVEEEEPMTRPKSILKIRESKESDIGVLGAELNAAVDGLKAELEAAGPASPTTPVVVVNDADNDNDDNDDDDVPIDSAFSQLATELNAAAESRTKSPKLTKKKKSGGAANRTPEKDEAVADAKAQAQLMADDIAAQLEVDTSSRSRANSTSRLRLSAMLEEEEEPEEE